MDFTAPLEPTPVGGGAELMKSVSVRVALLSCTVWFGGALCCAPLLHADPPPQPHDGVPPVHYLPKTVTLEPTSNTPLGKTLGFPDDDVVVGWTYDAGNEVYVPSSPTITIKNMVDPKTYYFYPYHNSKVTLTNSDLSKMRFFLHDSSTLEVGSGSAIGHVSVEDNGNLILAAGSRVTDGIFLEDSTSLVAGAVFLDGGIATRDSATAEISSSTGSIGLDASGTSTITSLNTDLRGGASANENATIIIQQGDVSGLGTNRNGLIDMTGGRAGDIQAGGDGVISLTEVFDVNRVIAGDFGAGATTGQGGLAMTGGSLNAAEILVLNRGKVIMGGVSGSLKSVTVRSQGFLDISSPISLAVTGAVNVSGKSESNLKHLEIARELRVSDTATLTMNSGSVGTNVFVSGSGVFSTTGLGPTISGSIFAFGASPLVNLPVGTVFGIAQIEGSGVLNLAGASIVGPVNIFDEALGSISGGSVDSDVSVGGTSRLVISGGAITGNLNGFGSSVTFMSGGRVTGTPFMSNNAVFNWSGGTFGLGGGLPGIASASFASDDVADVSPLVVAGAIPTGSPTVLGLIANGGAINVIGYDLESELIDPEYINPDNAGLYSVYQLRGRLADGTPLLGSKVLVANGTNATLNLILAVPEPTSLAVLVGLTLCASAIDRRRNRPAQNSTRRP